MGSPSGRGLVSGARSEGRGRGRWTSGPALPRSRPCGREGRAGPRALGAWASDGAGPGPGPSRASPCPVDHAAARAAHRGAAGGARGGAAVVRALRAGLWPAGGHARPVARPAQPRAAPAALLVPGRPALGRLLLLRGIAELRGALVGLRAAGRAVLLRQHQLLLLDRGHRALPVPEHRARGARAQARPPVLGLPRCQLGHPADHHRGGCRPQEDRLRRLGCVCGLVLGGPGGGGPRAVDAVDREAVGDAGLRHAARAVPPGPEAHQQSARGAVRVPAHLRGAPAPALRQRRRGRREAAARPAGLHLPARLEHCAFRPHAPRLPAGALAGAGRPARHREHLPGRGQLHPVRPRHPRRPHAALLPVSLLSPALCPEPGRTPQGARVLHEWRRPALPG